MNKIQVKRKRAVARGVYAFPWPGETGKRKWGVYVEGEFYPRCGFTKREAVNLAYAISISENVDLAISRT